MNAYMVCVLCLRVKLIMLVVLVFDMQCMHIGGIVQEYLSFLCYAVGAVAAANRKLTPVERNNVLNYEDYLSD